MSTVFEIAMGRLMADPNIGVDADYRAGGQGPATAVRIVRNMGSAENIQAAFRTRATNDRTIDVLAADCSPAKGDTWTLADGTILTALDADRNESGTIWTVTVR